MMRRFTALFLLFGAALSTKPASAAKKLAKRFLNVGDKQPPGYTHVVTSAPGRMIFISGRGGADAAGKMPADFTTQCENTFKDLEKCLALGGAKFEDVVKINYFVTDLAHTTELRRIRANYLNMKAPPAATLVRVGLGDGLLVEIEAIAMIPE